MSQGQEKKGVLRGLVMTILGVLSWVAYAMMAAWSAAPPIPEETKQEFVQLQGELGELQAKWREMGKRWEELEKTTRNPDDLKSVKKMREHHSEVSKTLRLFERLMLVNATPGQKTIALILFTLGLGFLVLGVRRLQVAVRDWELGM
jgi:hypothetical protein